MCLIAFAWKVHPLWRLVLIGNRDEFHARPTATLARWPGSPIIAGRDLQAGGTWLGATAAGRCAAVTNVRDLHAPVDGISRGLVVSNYLSGSRSASDHAQTLLATAASYRPFNLLLFDAQGACFLGNHPQPHVSALEPGVHALSNADLDTPWPKTCAIKQGLQAWADRGDDDLLPLLATLADEQVAPDERLPDTGVGLERERWLSSAFVRGEHYGTRASTLVALGHDGSGVMIERGFGPSGCAGRETRLDFGAFSMSLGR
ncbi:MAG: NRDE family protein [Rhodanobacter sp.]